MIRANVLSVALLLGWWSAGGCFVSPVAAQSSSSMFGNNSPSNRSAAGMPSMGGSNFNGMANSTGGSANAFGGSGFGTSGTTGSTNNSGAGGLGANGRTNSGANQGNFIGRNVNPEQFIGGNNMTGGNLSQQNSRRQGGLGNRNRNNDDFQNENANRTGSNQPPSLRARQKIGFDVPRPQPDRRQSQLQTRFSKLTERNAAMKGITPVTDDSGAVVLRGHAPSASVAKLAEKLVRLEPGVSSVRSELTFPVTADK